MEKKKILIITFTVPFPAVDGGKISVYGTVNYLRRFFSITLLFRIHHEDDRGNVERLKSLWPEVTIIAIDNIRQKKAWKKYLKISMPHNPFFGKIAGAFSRKNKAGVLSSQELFPFLPQDRKMADTLEALFRKETFNLIQVEVTYLLNVIHLLPPGPVKVFVQIENRYTLLQDYFQKNNDESLYAKYIVRQAAFTEFALMNEYDYVFALTQKDKEEMSKRLSAEKLFLAPFPVLDNMIAQGEYVYQVPDKIIFLGSQQHKPNADAVEWYMENMHHDIYQKHGLKLYVTGHWSQSFRYRYHACVFTGFVDDVAPLMEKAIMVSPIRMGGGGIRAKALQSMAMRVPLVSTTLGCEGIQNLQDGKNVLIADSARAFISCIDRLVNDPALHRQIVENAHTLIREHYSESAAGEIRRNIYNNILQK